jgi:hypothetical protein
VLDALGNSVVLLDDIVNDNTNFVIANALSPSKVRNRVVGAFASSVAFSLESISANSAARESGVAGSVIDGIRSMTKMIDAGVRAFLVVANVVAWRSGKAKATGSECFWKCLKCNSRQSKRQTEKRGDDTTKGMTSQPNVGIGVEFSDVVV